MSARLILLLMFLTTGFPLVAQDIESIPLIQINPQQSETPDTFKLHPETKYIAFYYSASWCGPCRTTTPALVEEYQRMTASNLHPVEIVFVSSDKSEQGMIDYMKQYQMSWPAVAWQSRSQVEAYAAKGIPHMALVDRATGAIITHGTGASGEGSVESVITRIREITGDTTEKPFRTGHFFSRYGTLLLIGLAVLVIFIIQKRRKTEEQAQL